MTWWTWVIVVTAGATLAAVALGRWRDAPDDQLHRVLPRWWIPAAAAVTATTAAPFFARQPSMVVATFSAALVWGLVLCHIDLRVRRLPDPLVLPAYPVAALLLVGCSAVTGRWWSMAEAAACSGAAVGVFLLLAVLAPGSGGLGLGDVKLAGALGLLLGWFGWLAAAAGLSAGFVLGGLLAAVLLLARRVDRRSHIAFGPAMVAGAFFACLPAAAVTG